MAPCLLSYGSVSGCLLHGCLGTKQKQGCVVPHRACPWFALGALNFAGMRSRARSPSRSHRLRLYGTHSDGMLREPGPVRSSGRAGQGECFWRSTAAAVRAPRRRSFVTVSLWPGGAISCGHCTSVFPDRQLCWLSVPSHATAMQPPDGARGRLVALQPQPQQQPPRSRSRAAAAAQPPAAQLCTAPRLIAACSSSCAERCTW